MSLTEETPPDTNRLPPLNALRAFEGAARHMSFQKAAEELFVTPAALSYQIKQLEAHLGATLFIRKNRAVELTDAGRVLRPYVNQGFANLRRGWSATKQSLSGNVLRVTAGPAYTAKWLAPRLFRFATRYPDIELRFVASLKTMDFDTDGVDVAIRFGLAEDDPAHHVTRLNEDFLIPLCTPAYAQRLKRPQDLLKATLLHDDSLSFLPDPPKWRHWFALAGMTNYRAQEAATHGLRFSHADHALDAAMEGAGIALARAYFADRDLVAGRLVCPFPTPLPTPGPYRFVCPQETFRSQRVQAFFNWIVEEHERTNNVMEELLAGKFSPNQSRE